MFPIYLRMWVWVLSKFSKAKAVYEFLLKNPRSLPARPPLSLLRLPRAEAEHPSIFY